MRPAHALATGLDRLFAADLSRPAAFVGLGLVFFALRAPFLDYGYGTDPDAWRVAMTAHHLLDTGEYFPSRLPGNPLHEFTITLFIAGGWIVTNLVTALVSLAGVYLFARILRRLRLPTPGLLTVGFAFTPLLFINSIATMDYMWALTAILAAYYAVLLRLPVWAGVCLGLAIGFRLQSLIVWLPLACLLLRQSVEGDVPGRGFRLQGLSVWRDVFAFSIAAGGVVLIAFAPVLAVYGGDFFNYYDASVGYRDVIRLLGKEALGVIGGLAVLGAAIVSLPRLRALPGDVFRDPNVAVWLGLILLYFVSFFRLPHEIAYLIPVFPFGFLLMGRYFRPAALVVAIGGILLAGVLDITTPGDDVDIASLSSARLGRGLVLSNADTMSSQREFATRVAAADIPDRSVVMAGFIFPQLSVRERDRLDERILQRDFNAISMLSDRGEAVDTQRDIRFVWLLTYEQFLAFRGQGYSFFVVPDSAGATSALYDYRPGLFGATFLHLDQAGPGAGKGTASTDR